VYTREFVTQLTEHRDRARAEAERLLQTAKLDGRDVLNREESRKFNELTDTLRTLESRIAEGESEIARMGRLPAGLERRSQQVGRMAAPGRLGTAAATAPLGFGEEELRGAYSRARHGESVVLETRAPGFSSGDSLLPPELYPIPTFPVHESRLLNRLNSIAIEAPSLEYVQVNSVVGAAAIVGEGQPKPEVTMPATKIVIPALKLAIHGGISWENLIDYDAFSNAVRVELMKQVVDLENKQLVYGNPATGGLNGMTTQAGILTRTASATVVFDDFAGAIADLRTGPALCEPDLCLLHPNTWANVRTIKDLYGRYYVSADPSEDQVEQIWGVDVLQSTAFNPGEAVLLDTQLMGRAAVRETLVLRIGYAGTDFTDNILRTVCEERLNLAVERPGAILWLKGLPTTAPLAEPPAKRK
jgi:HK97 family phage major capsid protein